MNKLKHHFLWWLVFLGTITFWYIWYSAYTSLSIQNDWAVITKDIWNNVITTINDIWNRTDWIYNSWWNIGIWISNPSNKLEVNWDLKAIWQIYWLWFFPAWVWYTKKPLECIDVCKNLWWRIATSEEMFSYATSKNGFCSIMWVSDSVNLWQAYAGYPMYLNRTTTWCWPTWTWDVPRLVSQSSNLPWTSTSLYDCWCYWIQ